MDLLSSSEDEEKRYEVHIPVPVVETSYNKTILSSSNDSSSDESKIPYETRVQAKPRTPPPPSRIVVDDDDAVSTASEMSSPEIKLKQRQWMDQCVDRLVASRKHTTQSRHRPLVAEKPQYQSRFGQSSSSSSVPPSIPVSSSVQYSSQPSCSLLDNDYFASDEVKSNKKSRAKKTERQPIRRTIASSEESSDAEEKAQTLPRSRYGNNNSPVSSSDPVEFWPKDVKVSIQEPSKPLILEMSTESADEELDEQEAVQVCKFMNQALFDYQREGIQFLYAAYRENRGAILGDDMGLGKTIQVIGLLSAVLEKSGTSKDRDSWRKLKKLRRNNSDIKIGSDENPGPVLIVVPKSVLENWKNELQKWMCCECHVITERGDERQKIFDKLERGLIEIAICTYGLLMNEIDRLHSIPYHLVVLDEMHRLKNPKTKINQAVRRIECPRLIGLTGTLMQNNHDELYCLMDTINPNCLGTQSEFENRYSNVIKDGRQKTATKQKRDESLAREAELRRRIKPFYLRRLKEVNPFFSTIRKIDRVVFCSLTDLQIRAYRRVLNSPDFQFLLRRQSICDCVGGQRGKVKGRKCCYSETPDDTLILKYAHAENPGRKCCPDCMMLPCLLELLKLSSHLELLKISANESDNSLPYQKGFVEMAFGEDCTAIGGIERTNNFEQLKQTHCSGKLMMLERLLNQWAATKDKALVFSQSTAMLDIIQAFLIGRACHFMRLDGSTSGHERQKLVDEFNKSNTARVFLISTLAGGVGLNITSASKVVIFEPNWNPAHDCQAQDRAYRYGQANDVEVFRLISIGTIEEIKYIRQIYKLQLTKATLEGKRGPRYFEAIQGKVHGELFGLVNLLKFEPEIGIMHQIKEKYQNDRTLDAEEAEMITKTKIQVDKNGIQMIENPTGYDDSIAVDDELSNAFHHDELLLENSSQSQVNRTRQSNVQLRMGLKRYRLNPSRAVSINSSAGGFVADSQCPPAVYKPQYK